MTLRMSGINTNYNRPSPFNKYARSVTNWKHVYVSPCVPANWTHLVRGITLLGKASVVIYSLLISINIMWVKLIYNDSMELHNLHKPFSSNAGYYLWKNVNWTSLDMTYSISVWNSPVIRRLLRKQTRTANLKHKVHKLVFVCSNWRTNREEQICGLTTTYGTLTFVTNYSK